MPSKEEHYARNNNQEDIIDSYGKTESERIEYIKNNWERQSDSANIYHVNEIGSQGEFAKKNVKYMSLDKKMEVVICDPDSNNAYIVTDPFNRGTYNFGTVWYEHFAKDMVPYFLWGNGIEDSANNYCVRRVFGARVAGFLGAD